MVLKDRKDGSSLPLPSGSFSKTSPSRAEMDVVDPYNRKFSPDAVLDVKKVEKKPGGWRAVSFILGISFFFFFFFFLVHERNLFFC